MQNRPKVSIVIPCYKVEDYIATCIESLQKQTLKELEMIFIDDCGGDNSIAIAEEYAKADSRIKILYNGENRGAGQSRNHGIDHATGEYIAFVDPDDWVDDNFYEVLYNRAKEGNYDIVKANRIQVRYLEDGAVRYKNSPVNDRIKAGMTQNKPLYGLFTSEHQTAIFNCDMVHKYKIYNGSSSHSENSVFLLKAAYYAKRFCLESGVAYYYLQREDSSVHVFDYKKFSGELCSFKEQMDILNDILKDQPGYHDFVGKKINFLIRRYNELKDIRELRDFRKEFVNTLCEELDKVDEKNKLAKYGRKVQMLLNHQTSKFIFASNFNKQIEWMKAKKKSGKAFLLRMKKKVYRVTEKTPTYKKFKFMGITFTKKIPPRFQFGEQELLYLQSYRGAIIFSKAFIEKDPVFADAYINAFTKNNKDYNCELPVDSELYKEHLERLKEGELCWRYTKRFGSISKATIYIDNENELCIKGEILGSCDVIDAEHFIIHPQLTRKIIDGVVLKDYIVKNRRGAIIDEMRTYLDFLFEEFKIEDNTKVAGMAYDAFPFNCILKEGHEYELFDLEFEYKEPLDKGYMIYKVARVLGPKSRKPVYFELCEHYGIVPMWEYWDNFNFRIWLDTISEPDDVPNNIENQELFQKYFIA